MDPGGRLGLTVLLAKNETEAREKFAKMHNNFLTIVEISQVLAISLAMLDTPAGTCFERRKPDEVG